MPHPILTVSLSDSLINIVAVNSHTEWQTVQIQISWLLQIWIYIVCKGRVYPGSAGQGLKHKKIVSVSVHPNACTTYLFV